MLHIKYLASSVKCEKKKVHRYFEKKLCMKTSYKTIYAMVRVIRRGPCDCGKYLFSSLLLCQCQCFLYFENRSWRNVKQLIRMLKECLKGDE